MSTLADPDVQNQARKEDPVGRLTVDNIQNLRGCRKRVLWERHGFAAPKDVQMEARGKKHPHRGRG